ncbi:retrovirus-related Pol polyprotein from transposon RE1 [Trichonephila clavipes]|nr:retrovirus-related Pol polyprotein from transposon RE1 [Trichonephila clavipes]
MYKDTKNFVRSCTICLSRKNAFKIPPAPHQLVEQSTEPGETCHMDIFGPLKTTLKGEDVGIFISRVKTAATRLQEAGHKLDDLYIGFQLIRWLPQEFQSTVQQIYRWKEEDFRVVKIEAELILEANRLQLMKQDLEKAENAYLSSFTSKKSKTLPGATAAAHGDPNGKNDYQKKSEFDKGVWVIDTAATSHFCNDKSLFLDLKPITNMKMSLATEDKSCPVEGIGTLRFRVKI